MAEGFPSIIVPGIIEHLDAQTVKKLGLLSSCVKDFEKLKDIVLELQPVLLDAEEQQAANDEIKAWLEKLTDILYEVEELLDDLSTKALRKELVTRKKKAKQVCIFFSKSNQLAFNRRMGPKIKTILNNLDHIANDMRKFHFEERHGKIPVEENRERDHNAFCPEVLIGRDTEKKAVVDFLMDSNVKENVSILPIVGTGGMGKTTLAQFAFNHERIQEYFQLKMWVNVMSCVSRDDVGMEKTIVRKILESARNEKVTLNPFMNPFMIFEKEIYGKKYLLVLDNVRINDREKWLRLKRGLIEQYGARGSKILVTTRSEEVADTMCTVKPYYLRGLDEDDSWYLFKRVAFKNGQEPDDEDGIVNVGKEIVRKCEGVPLIIITIGRLLYFKNSETEWLSFMNNELSRIHLNEEADILATLKLLIYDQLPQHLKQCFAYSCLFPKNYEIDKSTLINLWIAQGFIKSSNEEDECLEDAGHEYFMDLISRFFFEKVTTDWSGEVTSCKMNDLMHDLAMLIAGPSVTTLNSFTYEEDVNKSTRHLWVGYDIEYYLYLARLISKAKCRLRTFLSPSDSEPKGMTECDAIFSSFKTLRALQLGSRNLDGLPSSSICKLNGLRYLDLSGMYMMKKLPDSITSLQNLQTLKLCNCSWFEEWPRDFSRLVNLRHLDINGCWKLTYMPRGLGQLTKLRSLSDFLVSPLDSLNMHSGGLNELNGLNCLRGDLQIRNLGCGKHDVKDYRAANLNEKEKIRSLKLYWEDSFGLRDDTLAGKKLKALEPHRNLKRLQLSGYKGAEFPSWLSSLTNLVEFQLSKCEKLKCLPPLSELPSLKRLFLKYLEGIEYMSDSDDEYTGTFFPSLEELQLYYCPNLKGWRREEPRLLPSFPCLSELSISGCTELDSMPTFPCLEEELVLSNVRWKPMQMTMMMNMGSSTSVSSSFAPLSKLKHLRLHRIEDLHILPEKGLQNLNSLKSLHIVNCHRLKSLSQGIQYLTALQELRLKHCHNLYIGGNDEVEMGWKGLESLHSLDFIGLPKLESLPSGLEHVTTLKMLQISGCSLLTAIPEWIRNWTSLQEFEISNCPNLTLLPEGMRLLKTLKMLAIRQHCPLLLPRCEAHTGEDWPKIAHIPELYLDRSSMPKEEVMENVGKKFNVYYNYMS
ncbi:putative disease resistance protein RGA4 isoform X2 [Juglans microcarpa x Juglans regia]|uniref:putative disease resistance protein RGA4 isoform X2 n=1 Tax=Juglans microcarpa x Juglans regia TaxID=2249226 RepID=UPI001B7E0F33|nr:putative disease resistance protein RGA4 isoform X2 [Juglans microcarpa x Juglans regia]